MSPTAANGSEIRGKCQQQLTPHVDIKATRNPKPAQTRSYRELLRRLFFYPKEVKPDG